jgi:hypothetical protein
LLVTDQDFENARQKSGTKSGTVGTGNNRQDQEANPGRHGETAVLSGVSTNPSAEDKGFEPSTGFPAPDFESGSTVEKPNENKGFSNLALNARESANLSDLLASLSDSMLSEPIKQAIRSLIQLDLDTRKAGSPSRDDHLSQREPMKGKRK